MDVHESPVTCTAYFADCPPDVIPVLYSIGAKHKKTGYSHKVTEFNYFYSIRYCWHCMINPLRPLRSAIPYGTCAVTVWTPHNVYVIRLWILSFMPCFCTYTMILKIGPLRFPWHLGSGTKKKVKLQPTIYNVCTANKNILFLGWSGQIEKSWSLSYWRWCLRFGGQIQMGLLIVIPQPNVDECVGHVWEGTAPSLIHYLGIVLYHSVFVGEWWFGHVF